MATLHSCLKLISATGFAGNDSPSFVFPTAIATKGAAGGAGGSGSGRPAVANKPSFLTGGAGPGSQLSAKRGTEDLDFFIGDEALVAASGPGYGIHYPVRHGQVENWDHMERFWSNSIFKYLRVEPEDHYFLLTEPVSSCNSCCKYKKANVLSTATQSTGKSRKHCGNNVRIL